MMTPIHSSWQGATWFREEGSPERISRALLADLTAEVEPVDDDVPVMIRAGVLRALLAAHERLPRTYGAAITDDERGVTYHATIGRGDGRVWLRSVEVIPHVDEPDPRVFRVPVQAVADLAAQVLAEQSAVGEPDHVAVIGVEMPSPPSSAPTAEELREMLREGMTRKALAKRLSRSDKPLSLSRVDELLRVARRDHPELDWPARRRGPAPSTTPQTPGSDRQPGDHNNRNGADTS